MMTAKQLELPLGDRWSAKPSNDNNRSEWERRFKLFHRDNPHVYEMVKKYTFDVIATGRRRFSIISIFERIRWFSMIENTEDTFKLNQNYNPYYARMFMEDFPEYAGFFETRTLRS